MLYLLVGAVLTMYEQYMLIQIPYARLWLDGLATAIVGGPR